MRKGRVNPKLRIRWDYPAKSAANRQGKGLKQSQWMYPDGFGFILLRLRPYFARGGYATVVTRLDAWNRPYIYHVESFFEQSMAEARRAAYRYGRAFQLGKGRVGAFRSLHLPHDFNYGEMPPREDRIPLPEDCPVRPITVP